MTVPILVPAPSANIPAVWAGAVQRALPPGARIAACVCPNINEQQRYRSTCLLVTNEGFYSFREPEQPVCESWKLGEIASLKTRDEAGLGTIELLGPTSRLGVWYYTLDHGPDVLRLIEAFENLRPQDAGSPGSVEPGDPVVPADVPEVEPALPAPTTKALFRLARFASPHWKMIFAGFGLSVMATVAGLVPPYLTMPLLDQILIPYQNAAEEAARTGTPIPPEVAAHMGKAWMYLVGLLAGAIVAWVLGWFQGAVLAWVSERIAADLRNASYAHLQRLSLEYFGGKRTGDLMSRISTDSERLCQFLSDGVVDFTADCFLIVGTAAVLVMIDPSLALVSLLPFPFVVWMMYYSRDRLQSGFQSGGRAWAAMTSVLADTIPGIRVVKAFAQEEREIARFHIANAEVVTMNDRVNRVWTFFWPMILFVNQLGMLVVWACGIYFIYQSQITVGVLTAFLAYIARFYSRLESMSRMINASQRAAASAQRMFEVLDRVSSVPDPIRPVPTNSIRGDLELRNVGFRYGNRKVLHDLNLKINAGEMIGLVGHTGAGKSTLINLICRFYDVAEGAIYADGHDIRSFRVEEWRRNVGIVLQDPFLFYGTIAENIAYGRPGATRAEVIAAAKAARAHNFILQLPDGYDSLVGERGQSLSGGERQRISIARAILIDPRILILDEATSAVDTQTEREIQEALQNLVQGRTTIAIAHRLSTLRKSHRIIVLDRGRIVEAGSHETLMEHDGHYARLVRAQQEMTRDIAC